MAQRKSGPVKPPVIDLKAREAEPAPSPVESRVEEVEPAAPIEEIAPSVETATVGEPSRIDEVASTEAAAPIEEAPSLEEPVRTPPPPPPPRPPARLAMPWSAISIAAIGGALLGAGLVYALGNWLPLPNQRPVIADPATRLDAQDASLGTIDSRLVALEEQTRRTQVSLDATIAQMDSGLGDVRQQIGALPAPSPAADLAPIEAELQSLSDRITAIGAGASSADAAALTETISTIQSGIAELRTQVSDSTGKVAAIDSAIAALQRQVAEMGGGVSTPATAGAAVAASADVGAAVRLPLIVSGLESALSNGRPFAIELQSLKAMRPDLAVPSEMTSAAETGLPRPDTVAARFNAAVPDILAGRAATGTGDIGADALEWMKGLLALRPVGEVEGSSPEAIVSQLEAAVGRHDFTAAAQMLGALPPAMQAGAGEAGADIVKLAAADKFLADLRAQALATSTEATP